MLLNAFSHPLRSHMVSTITFPVNHLCRGGSARTTGTLDPQIAGKWHIITLQDASEYVEHEILHERFHVTHFAGCAILFNKDPSSLTSAPNRSTFTARGEGCKIILLKENLDGFYKAFFHVSLFVVLPFRHCIIAAHQQYLYMSRKKGIAKKITQTIRAIMVSQDIDLVVGDFNGTAWRWRSRDNI